MQIINKFLRLIKVYIFFISFVLFIIIFSTTFLHANNFKVSNIEISEAFELDFNKNKVINKGFRAAFTDLLSMIITSGDKNKLKKTSLNEVKGMIDSFTISDEKFINDEYFAMLEVIFDKKKILSFLERKNIFPSIPLRNKVLLIPILFDLEEENIFLFDENIFYKKWNDNNQSYHLLDYLLPSEDIEDLTNIRNNINNIEDYNFLDLIEKYDLEDYIISIIFKNKDTLKVLSKINLNNSLKIDNQIFNEVDLKNEENFYNVLESIKVIYENYWKKNNQINTSIKLPLTISINSKDYQKIKEIEKILSNLNLVSEFEILRFDNKKTYFRIIYNGSPKTFITNMKKKEIDFFTTDNIWQVK